MGFFKSEKGTIISEIFKLIEEHANLRPNWAYEVMLFEDHLQIKQKVGGKANATLRYSQITDVLYESKTTLIEKKESPITRAAIGKMLFGDTGAIIGAMTADKKTKKDISFYFLIAYTASDDEEKYIVFEDTRLYKGRKLAKKLMELCNISDTAQTEKDNQVQNTTVEL